MVGKAIPRGTGTGVPSRLVEEMKRGRLIVWAVASLLIPMALIVIASPARAYGNTAVWQLGVSQNCDNPSLCENLGGFWGWIEFDNDGTGDATFAGCGHLVGPFGGGGADAFQIEIEGWFIADGFTGMPDFFVTGGTMTLTGHTGGPPVTVPLTTPDGKPIDEDHPFDTGFPAVAGHYDLAQLFGFSAPGVNFVIQVVQIPNR